MSVNKVIFGATTLLDLTTDTAAASDVLSGKTFHTADGNSVSGSMTNRGAVSAFIDGISTASYSIPAGYHNGNGKVQLTSDIAQYVAECYATCENKGATLPNVRTIPNLADCIATISGTPTGYPVFSYTGTYSFYDEGDSNWHLILTSSGTLTFSFLGNAALGIDTCVVGGGAGGNAGKSYTGGTGGNGGCVYFGNQFFPALETGYEAVIGLGGASKTAGGESSIFGYAAPGGLPGGTTAQIGYASATRGGTGTYNGHGNNGVDGIYAFNDATMNGVRYGGSGAAGSGHSSKGTCYTYASGGATGGGNGGGDNEPNGYTTTGAPGMPNTGGGGGGGRSLNACDGGAGGSGVIILRNHRT